ncbi:extracellular protease-like isoform X2 [Oculina patagonica]
MAVWIILLILGMANGDQNVEFDISETKVFSASLECSPRYRTTEKIECQFNLKNEGQRDFSVLKWRTPLQQLTSDCLSVTRNGNKIPYDGIFIKRSTPGPDQFVLVAVGQTVSSTFEVSEGYDISKAGTYSIAVDTYIEYVVGSVKGMNEPGKPGIPIKISHLSSPSVSFQVVGRKAGYGTLGQRARSLEKERKRTLSVGNSPKRSESVNVLLDPVVKGNAAQKELTKEIHRASYLYIEYAISDLQSSPDRVRTWFGTTSADFLITKFREMERLLRSDTFTYVHGGDHCSNIYAYTWLGSRTMHLCGLYESSSSLSGFYSKMTTIVHELAHALAYIDDIGYGVSYCKNLAKSAPHQAANNAENYCYFAASLFPFNYGFDAMTTLSNGYTYLFKGNIYVRYTDTNARTLNPAYPTLINDGFDNLPENFTQGFDSFIFNKLFGHPYATRGDQYIRFTDGKASTVSKGYPHQIYGNWGVSRSMSTGFDSMTQLPNGKTYVTKGPLYVRYSDKALEVVDSGYPKRLDSGEWGNLPENFKSGFDAMEVIPNGQLYVIKGTEYLRYSNPFSHVDAGYPLPIKGNWGDVPQ